MDVNAGMIAAKTCAIALLAQVKAAWQDGAPAGAAKECCVQGSHEDAKAGAAEKGEVRQGGREAPRGQTEGLGGVGVVEGRKGSSDNVEAVDELILAGMRRRERTG